jgi:hypothetical protein
VVARIKWPIQNSSVDWSCHEADTKHVSLADMSGSINNIPEGSAPVFYTNTLHMTGVTTEQPSILRELPDLAVDTVQIK